MCVLDFGVQRALQAFGSLPGGSETGRSEGGNMGPRKLPDFTMQCPACKAHTPHTEMEVGILRVAQCLITSRDDILRDEWVRGSADDQSPGLSLEHTLLLTWQANIIRYNSLALTTCIPPQSGSGGGRAQLASCCPDGAEGGQPLPPAAVRGEKG